MTRAGTSLMTALKARPVVKPPYTAMHNGKEVEVGSIRVSPENSRKFLVVDRTDEHFYRKEQALGFDRWIYDDAIRHGISRIYIFYHGMHGVIVYRAELAVWEDKGFDVEYEGFDRQRQLATRFMEIVEQDNARPKQAKLV